MYTRSLGITARTGDRVNDWGNLPEIERDPDRVSGAWVFRGTRVPVTALFENLRDGTTVDQFLQWFPGVSRTQVNAVLAHEARLLEGQGFSQGASYDRAGKAICS
jgi:uncharacterized protein (DUF433 family)